MLIEHDDIMDNIRWAERHMGKRDQGEGLYAKQARVHVDLSIACETTWDNGWLSIFWVLVVEGRWCHQCSEWQERNGAWNDRQSCWLCVLAHVAMVVGWIPGFCRLETNGEIYVVGFFKRRLDLHKFKEKKDMACVKI